MTEWERRSTNPSPNTMCTCRRDGMGGVAYSYHVMFGRRMVPVGGVKWLGMGGSSTTSTPTPVNLCNRW